jgi:hypothetical protein
MTTSQSKITKTLLTSGMIAGPLYIGVGLVEGLTRQGFSFLHHDLSLLANGNLGWIHSMLLIISGLLTIAGAIGMGRMIKGNKGGTWSPRLLGLYGLGFVGAGIFKADPAMGFPPGTAADAHVVSTSGLLHFMFGAVGFLGLIATCFIIARYFKATEDNTWATFSKFTGAFYFLSFIGIAIGSQQTGAILTTVILGFTAAVILGWAWVTMTLGRLKSKTTR